MRFFPMDTCNHSCYTIYAFFCHVYLCSFLLCRVFIPKYMTIFLQTCIYVRTKKPIYTRFKQACVYGVTESHRIRGTELVLIVIVWFLFIAFTVVVVVGSLTTDLLESMACLLRDCVRYFMNADRNRESDHITTCVFFKITHLI